MDMRAELLEHAHDQTGALLREMTGADRPVRHEFVSAALPEGVITVHLGHTHEISITGPESGDGVWACPTTSTTARLASAATATITRAIDAWTGPGSSIGCCFGDRGRLVPVDRLPFIQPRRGHWMRPWPFVRS